ncbi:MAG TPA: hypothetical protein VNT20_18410 [Flavisolibacter sp.]|jgi:hypothetical protein|nr:hypothetical protein [Flavisolibacter sp.]
MKVLNAGSAKNIPSLDQVTQTTTRTVTSSINNIQQSLKDIQNSIVQQVTPVILKAQKEEALLKAKQEKPIIKSNDFTPVDVKLPEANTKQFDFNLNTYNVESKSDLERLTDRLFSEHTKATRNSRKEDAALLERTINVIEMQGVVPGFSYQPLALLGIKLVKP